VKQEKFRELEHLKQKIASKRWQLRQEELKQQIGKNNKDKDQHSSPIEQEEAQTTTSSSTTTSSTDITSFTPKQEED